MSTETRIDLSKSSREKVCELLNTCLANLSDLSLQSKQAHWNVHGPRFKQLHELFDAVYEVAQENIDEVAERISQLGGIAGGTLKAISSGTSLKEYPLTALSENQHIENVASAIAATVKITRKGISQTDEYKDDVTSDLLTEVSANLDKQLWFVEAHLQGK